MALTDKLRALLEAAGLGVAGLEARWEEIVAEFPEFRDRADALRAEWLPKFTEAVGDEESALALLSQAVRQLAGEDPGYSAYHGGGH